MILDEALQLLHEYYGERFRIVPVDHFGDNQPLKLYKYLLLPKDAVPPHTDPDGVLRLGGREYYKKYHHYDSILLLVSQAASNIRYVKNVDEVLSPERFDALYKTLVNQLGHANEAEFISEETAAKNRDIANALSNMPICFSKLLKYRLLCSATGAWENNGETLVKSGVVSIEDLPSCREDIWDIIQAHANLSHNAGNGIALKFLEAARMGTYARRGMPPEDEALLRRCGVPDWFVSYMKNVRYLFPKGHCVDRLLRICIEDS